MHSFLRCSAIFVAAACGVAGASAQKASEPVQVMIVGTFHMANPGLDLHNTKAPDVLEPGPQAEIAGVVGALAKFQPTRVMSEGPADATSARYAQYLSGSLPPSRDEVVQLGFRLAKAAGLKHVYGIDVGGDFPYEAVQAYATAHGQTALLDQGNAAIEARMQPLNAMLAKGQIAAPLRWMNDPAHVKEDNAFYRTMLKVGGGSEQPGAELLTAWYKRNFLICANLLQNTEPGDRVVVFYGAGHLFLLRQCVAETPGFRLVEANDYLPK